MVPFALLLKIAFQGSTGFGTPSGIDTDPGASRNAVTESPSDPGIFDDRILFGQSATFSGLARELGIDEMLGIQAAFGELNQAGGVHGRQLNLTTLYDYYEPNSAYANTKILIYHAGGFTLIGEVGTPISRSASPLAGAEGIPFIAPFTGAKFLRDASLKNSVNLRASYYQETEEMVARLTEDLGFTRVAFFPQNDTYGQAGLEGTLQAFELRGLPPWSPGITSEHQRRQKAAGIELAAVIADYEDVLAMCSRYSRRPWGWI